jgi:hypothetical protein
MDDRGWKDAAFVVLAVGFDDILPSKPSLQIVGWMEAEKRMPILSPSAGNSKL